MSIFNLQSVESMRIKRFRTFVKHHSTVEKYMANRNQNWMVFRDRWEGLSGAEGLYCEQIVTGGGDWSRTMGLKTNKR